MAQLLYGFQFIVGGGRQNRRLTIECKMIKERKRDRKAQIKEEL